MALCIAPQMSAYRLPNKSNTIPVAHLNLNWTKNQNPHFLVQATGEAI